MITVDNFYATSQLLEVGKGFTELFGGRFFGSVPGGRLSYMPKERKGSRLSPADETVGTVLQTLQDSIRSKQNLVIERWPLIEHKPGRIQ